MNIPNDELDEWAERSHRVNGALLQAITLLQSGRTQDALDYVWEAQRRNNILLHGLEKAGATDPGAERTAQARAAFGLPAVHETPLELLSSPANRRLAEHLREAARAAAEVEKERGQQAGFSEQLECYADATAIECYGPVGLRGFE